MKTVATFVTVEEAHNLRAFLESCEVPAFVRDENLGATYSLAIGGIRVDVDEADYPRAVELMANPPASPPDGTSPA